MSTMGIHIVVQSRHNDIITISLLNNDLELSHFCHSKSSEVFHKNRFQPHHLKMEPHHLRKWNHHQNETIFNDWPTGFGPWIPERSLIYRTPEEVSK